MQFKSKKGFNVIAVAVMSATFLSAEIFIPNEIAPQEEYCANEPSALIRASSDVSIDNLADKTYRAKGGTNYTFLNAEEKDMLHVVIEKDKNLYRGMASICEYDATLKLDLPGMHPQEYKILGIENGGDSEVLMLKNLRSDTHTQWVLNEVCDDKLKKWL